MKAINILARSLDLDWVSPDANSWHLRISKDGGNSFRFVNDGQGEGYEGSTTLQLFPLRPGKEYIVSIHAGNRFEYESQGRRLTVKTLTREQESGETFTCFLPRY